MTTQPLFRGALSLGLGIGFSMLAAIAPAIAAPNTKNSAIEPSAQADEAVLGLPFTDVSPDHWAYAALLNLAGTYGCISGYPDGSFRGEEAVTRYEFAAGMDSCLSVLSGLVQQQQAEQGQAVEELIEAMEQSLSDLRQLETEVPTTP
ncbi:S-layer homology domain-containing protein [Nodosilinea sp. LEGE 07088]|uniref:S-layer homology domain-containing protein n=1 Tax=Nodosilinea sp. LEGE 07088 TaxID=2777968 RepID=UPI001D15BC7A|nr:S-layer homology domain-containing protein [Nodosilinea sp. LEGE 07088]